VARRYGLNANMLFTWRRREQQAGGASAVGEPVNIVPVRVVGAQPTATAIAPGSMGRMEIELVGGERIIVGADVDAGALARIAKALSRR
jgi:transposase